MSDNSLITINKLTLPGTGINFLTRFVMKKRHFTFSSITVRDVNIKTKHMVDTPPHIDRRPRPPPHHLPNFSLRPARPH